MNTNRSEWIQIDPNEYKSIRMNTNRSEWKQIDPKICHNKQQERRERESGTMTMIRSLARTGGTLHRVATAPRTVAHTQRYAYIHDVIDRNRR
jgi:hypothetical protein